MKVWEVVLVVALGLALAWVIFIFSGCGPPPKREPARVITVKYGCLDEVGKPPEVPEVLGTVDHTIDSECPRKWEFCADAKTAGKLVKWISAAQGWMRDAVTRCALEKSEGVP